VCQLCLLGDGSGGPVDNFFNDENGDPSGKGQIFRVGNQMTLCIYNKNVDVCLSICMYVDVCTCG